MWAIATFRYQIGWDYTSYLRIFEEIRRANTLSGLQSLRYEPGFTLLTKGMTLFIHSFTAMYGFYQLLILLPVVWLLYRYCEDVWLSTWLYVTLTFFYTSMNFTRQALAASILLLGYPFLRQRRLVPYLGILLLAASFHKSALIMLPIYFLCCIPLTRRRLLVYSGCLLLALWLSPSILRLAVTHLFPRYRSYLGSFYLQGFSPVYLLMPLLLLLLCAACYPFWRGSDPDAPLLLSLTIISVSIWAFICRHFILERFSIYPYSLAVLVGVPSALRSLLPGREGEALAALQRRDGISADLRQTYRLMTALILAVTFCYHWWGSRAAPGGFHGVFPYRWIG